MSEQRILHLITDNKFIDRAFREFELIAPGAHRYVRIGSKRELRFVRNTPVEFIAKEDWQTEDFSQFSAIILHSLPQPDILKTLPGDRKVLWIGWGFDYYPLLLSKAYPGGMVMPGTRRLATARVSGKPLARHLRDKGKGLYKSLRADIWRVSSLRYLSRIDYFAPVIDSEFRQAKQLNPSFSAEYLDWNYGTFEDDLSDGLQRKDGKNILVGNSAIDLNNHVEAFEAIARIEDLADRKLIVPLTYGSADYRAQLIGYGKNLFGDNFVPLVDHLPLAEYLEIVGGCGYVVMNHLRQQAFANISTALANGSRVFMNSSSPLYRWLLDRGFRIDSIDPDDSSPGIGGKLEPLGPEQMDKNRELMIRLRGRKTQREKTRKLVNLLLGGEACGPGKSREAR